MGRSNESSIIYVRTQLAIATAKERIKKLTSKYEAKQMKLARVNRLSAREYVRTQLALVMLVKASSLTSLKTIDSCNKLPYLRTHVRTQLAIATVLG